MWRKKGQGTVKRDLKGKEIMITPFQALEAGRHAFMVGAEDACPDDIPKKLRRLWYDGYYDARILFHLADVFDKNEVKWP